MGILSNYATDSLVTASCRIAFRYLSRQKDQGREIAEKIALASQFAQADPYRAATHNKGIFNGIDAILIATGNDWRAIEAGAHAFASQDGRYQGLSRWTLDLEREELVGQMTLPMPVATKGGSIGLNPRVALSHELLGNPSAKELAQGYRFYRACPKLCGPQSAGEYRDSARTHEIAGQILGTSCRC